MKERAADVVKLTPEDKRLFREAAAAAGPAETLAVYRFISDRKDKFAKADWKYMCSCLGRRSEHLLRNVVNNLSWED